MANSIAEIGLLHPIVVHPDGRLIAGRRRLEAFKTLGHDDIPATVLDIAAIVRGELAENLARLNFTQSELVDIGEAVAEELRAEAHERKIEGGRVGGSEDKQSFAEASKGQSRDAIARHISEVSGQKMSGFTYEKAKGGGRGGALDQGIHTPRLSGSDAVISPPRDLDGGRARRPRRVETRD